MSTSRKVLAALAALASVAAVALPVTASAGVGQTVKIKTTVTINPAGYYGKVSASNANCVEERIVVLKQKGKGPIARGTTNAAGKWTIDTEELNENIKIPAKVFVEVKPVTEGTAGTIYKCLAATSKTVEIAGG